MAKASSSSRIAVGVFGAPHGVRGEIRLKSYTGDPLTIADYAPLTDKTGERRFVIKSARLFKDDLLVVKIDGVADRDQAAALTRMELFVTRDVLPDADEDEFYHADLVGLQAVDEEGREIGSVTALHNFGAGDILDIKPKEGGASLLIPFTKAIVPQVELKAGTLTVILPDEIEGEEEDKA
jgi:16S rRNA processing protein RimM